MPWGVLGCRITRRRGTLGLLAILLCIARYSAYAVLYRPSCNVIPVSGISVPHMDCVSLRINLFICELCVSRILITCCSMFTEHRPMAGVEGLVILVPEQPFDWSVPASPLAAIKGGLYMQDHKSFVVCYTTFLHEKPADFFSVRQQIFDTLNLRRHNYCQSFPAFGTTRLHRQAGNLRTGLDHQPWASCGNYQSIRCSLAYKVA